MNRSRRRCPVCWQTIYQTIRGNIAGHFDSTGRNICPGTGMEYTTSVTGRIRGLK